MVVTDLYSICLHMSLYLGMRPLPSTPTTKTTINLFGDLYWPQLRPSPCFAHQLRATLPFKLFNWPTGVQRSISWTQIPTATHKSRNFLPVGSMSMWSFSQPQSDAATDPETKNPQLWAVKYWASLGFHIVDGDGSGVWKTRRQAVLWNRKPTAWQHWTKFSEQILNPVIKAWFLGSRSRLVSSQFDTWDHFPPESPLYGPPGCLHSKDDPSTLLSTIGSGTQIQHGLDSGCLFFVVWTACCLQHLPSELHLPRGYLGNNRSLNPSLQTLPNHSTQYNKAPHKMPTDRSFRRDEGVNPVDGSSTKSTTPTRYFPINLKLVSCQDGPWPHDSHLKQNPHKST